MTEPIFDLVIADLRKREAQGAETYGRARMEAFDGRESLQDAYEEALDLVAYLRKAIAERDADQAALQFAYRIIGEDTNSTAKLTERLRLAEAVCLLLVADPGLLTTSGRVQRAVEEWQRRDELKFAENAPREATAAAVDAYAMTTSC